jgi:hypothetical protein
MSSEAGVSPLPGVEQSSLDGEANHEMAEFSMPGRRICNYWLAVHGNG